MEQFLQPPASAPAAAVHPPIGGFFPNYGSLIPACFPLSMAPPAPVHGAPSRLSLAAGTTVDFRHPPHTLDSSKLLARPPHYAMQNFPGYFPAALPTNYPGAMARPQSGFIPVTANTGVCGSHYDLFGGGGSKDKDLNAAEEESHNLSSRLSDASSSPKPSIQDDTSQENVISSSCPRSHEAGYGGTADWPGTTVAAESGGKTMDLDSGNVVVSAAADPENPDGSSQTGEEGGSGGGRKYPDYCRTITVKDAHGQTKELVFPRALDLDRPKRARTTFSPDQLLTLEREFRHNQYLVGRERTELAERLGLSETQVKVWFQNRRTKHKRDKQRDLPPPGPPDCGLFHMPPTNQSVTPALPPSSLFRQGASSFHRPFHM